jgi:hypothetical protein
MVQATNLGLVLVARDALDIPIWQVAIPRPEELIDRSELNAGDRRTGETYGGREDVYRLDRVESAEVARVVQFAARLGGGWLDGPE